MFVRLSYAVAACVTLLCVTLLGAPPAVAQPSANQQQTVRPLIIPAEDIEGEALATLVVNRLRFGVRTELGGTLPRSSPELTGFFQNLDLGGGYHVTIGPYASIPLGAGPSPFALRFGADAFAARMKAERITNQLVPGSLQVSGNWKQYGVIPYAGLAWIGGTGVRGLSLFADVGYGFARHTVDLRTTVPVVEGNDTTGILLTRFGFEIPIARNVRIGASASHLRTANNDFRVLPAGPSSSFGENNRWAFAAHLTADLVWRNETSGQIVVWHLDTAGQRATERITPSGR